METIIIHPENEAQQKALQLILEGFKVPDGKEPISDTTHMTQVILTAGLDEVRLFKQGKLKTTSAKEFLNEL
jgi:hypothetical protein